VSGSFLYLAFHKVPLADLGVALRRVDGRWLAVAAGISLFIMFLMHQLQLLQERLVLDTQNYCDVNLIRHLQDRS